MTIDVEAVGTRANLRPNVSHRDPYRFGDWASFHRGIYLHHGVTWNYEGYSQQWLDHAAYGYDGWADDHWSVRHPDRVSQEPNGGLRS
jgi:hypothetical protein